MLKKLVLFILFISFVSLLQSNEFKEQRVKAIDMIATGVEENKKSDVNKGLKLLSILSKKGDLEIFVCIGYDILKWKDCKKILIKHILF